MSIILGIVFATLYVMGGIATFNFVAPRVAWHQAEKYPNQSGPDDMDRIDGQWSGAIMGLSWPASIPAVLSCFIIKSLIFKCFRITKKKDFWDRPAPLQSPVKAFRERRLAEREAQVIEHRKAVNSREIELGFPLTQWDDFPVRSDINE